MRLDLAIPVLALTMGLVGLALTGGRMPKPALTAWTPVAVATDTPTPTPTEGWWAEVSFETPTPVPLPTLPKITLEGWGDTGEEVPFTVLSCPRDDVKISGIYVSKRRLWWDVHGTAAIPDLWYWKAEISPDGERWTMLYASGAPVAGGLLLEFNTATVAPGVYHLRLTAVDKTGNFPEPCEVLVEVKR